MRKLVILAICIAILLATSATALMECSVVPPSLCTGAKVIGMTALSNDGSHASIPSDQNNAFVACCEEITISYESEDADIYLTETRNAHVSRVSGENGIKINGVSCGYFNSCRNYDTCVFSISGDRDAHISGCNNFAFSTKLCCRAGELIGEEIPISPLGTLREEIRNMPASPQEGMGTIEQTREEQPLRTKARRVPLPSNVKNFLKNLLRSRFADIS